LRRSASRTSAIAPSVDGTNASATTRIKPHFVNAPGVFGTSSECDTTALNEPNTAIHADDGEAFGERLSTPAARSVRHGETTEAAAGNVKCGVVTDVTGRRAWSRR